MSTATTSNAMSSVDRTQTSTSPAPVRGNYAAIPSSSSEWPTIEQANNMAVQAPAAKPAAPNKNDKTSEGTKSSPELSDGSQEVFEDAVVAASEVVVSVEAASSFATSTPVAAESTQTTASAWKPYRQSSPQSMGACTSAVTTTGSSSVTVTSSHEAGSRLTSARHGGDVPGSYKPFHLQEAPGAQVLAQARSNRVGDSMGLDPVTSQENWEPKVPLNTVS